MLARRVMALGLAAILLSIFPTATADDTLQAASPLSDGVSTNGYVCFDDGCSPNDEIDWWKINAFKGDIVQIGFTGSMNNGNWLCINDGWEADFSLHDSSGSQIASQAMSDTGSSASLTTTMPTAGMVYVKIKGTDSWCNDGVDYTLNPSVEKANRDIDEDGFIDNEDDCDDLVGTSTNDRNGCTDTDGDGWSDSDSGWGVQNGADAFAIDPTQWLDTDNDGYGDNFEGNEGDHCPYSRGYSNLDRFGCLDSDGDGFSNEDPGALNGLSAWYAHPLGSADAFTYDNSQWNDTDEDGFGDNWHDESWNQSRIQWGIGQWLFNTTTPDACPFITGESNQDRYGCPDDDADGWSNGDENWTIMNGSDAFVDEPTQWSDRDFDGWGDNHSEGAKQVDDFSDNPTQWRDTDEDGWGDNRTYGATQIDDFPFVNSQYRDTDGDGYGDNFTGFEGDVCVYSTAEEVESGWISHFDRRGCKDSDMDGYSDPSNDWISHPAGFADAFPDDRSQWFDSDDDEFGDNLEYFDGQSWREAFRGDSCHTTEGSSTMDRWGCPDYDGDGWSDPTVHWLASPGGSADSWPYDNTQWHDLDGDNRGDNPLGTTADACVDSAGTSLGPTTGGDRWGCPDTDGDGWSDLGDAFIHEPTQWRDSDGDGYGDEQFGNRGDACPDTRGTSLLDRLGCRDTDGDGWSDPTDNWKAHPFGQADAFPTEALQWKDSDGDGFGDVPLGALRDDCPEVHGLSKKDVQGCPDNNRDGWSNEYGEYAAAIAIMGEDPAASWMTYLVIGLGFILGAAAALTVRISRDKLGEEEALFNAKVSEEEVLLISQGEQITGEGLDSLDGMIPLSELPPLPPLNADGTLSDLPMPSLGGENDA